MIGINLTMHSKNNLTEIQDKQPPYKGKIITQNQAI